MVFDIRTLATINFAFQILLFIIISYASYMAKKSELRKHCNIIRISVLLQIAIVIAIMLPSFSGYLENRTSDIWFNTELLLHHSFGLLLLGFWIYINLVYSMIIQWPRNFKSIMRSAYIIWMLSLIAGLHIYIRIYL